MPRNDYYDRDQEEWRRRREREQQGGGQGEFGSRGQWEGGQSGYGLGSQSGYGQSYGQGGHGQGYVQGGYGQGFGRVGEFGQAGYGQGMYGQGGYTQGGYSQGGFGRGYGTGYRQGGPEQSQWRGSSEESAYDQGGYGRYGQSGYGQSGYGPTLGYSSTVMVGRFYGRGPKGYRRSDDRIREDVSEELFRHPEIDASEVEIQAQNGEVTLTGKVEDRRQKRLAEDLAERVSGVTDVHNQLKVDKGFFAELFGTGKEDREREREQEGRTSTARRSTAGTSGNR
jgi:hypothetical protein